MSASLYWQSDETLETGSAAPTGARAQPVIALGPRPAEEAVAESDWSGDLDRIMALADAARLAAPDPAVAASLSALVERLHGHVSAYVLAGLPEQLQQTVTALVTIIDQISGLEAARAAIAPFDQAFAELPREVSRNVSAKAIERADEAKRNLAAALAQMEDAEQAQASPLPLKQKHARSAALLDSAEGHAQCGLEAAYSAVMTVAEATMTMDLALNPFHVVVTYDGPALAPAPDAARSEAPDALLAGSVPEADSRGWAEDPVGESVLQGSELPGNRVSAHLSVTEGLEMSLLEDARHQTDTQHSAVVEEQSPVLSALVPDMADGNGVGEQVSVLSSHQAAGSQVQDLADEGIGGEAVRLDAQAQVFERSSPISPPEDDYSLAERRLTDLRNQFRTKQQAKASFTLANYARTCLF